MTENFPDYYKLVMPERREPIISFPVFPHDLPVPEVFPARWVPAYRQEKRKCRRPRPGTPGLQPTRANRNDAFSYIPNTARVASPCVERGLHGFALAVLEKIPRLELSRHLAKIPGADG